jgi:hypothetical protein
LLGGRLAVAKQVFLHPAKRVAEAMFDCALRRIDAIDGTVTGYQNEFAPQRLLSIGDDALLSLVAAREAAVNASADGSVRNAAAELCSGRVFAEIACVDAAALARGGPEAAVRAGHAAKTPGERNRIEAALRRRLNIGSASPLIFAVAPVDMQFKAAEFPIVWNGVSGLLEDLAADIPLLAGIASLRGRYQDLWSASIITPPDVAARPDVRKGAAGTLDEWLVRELED